ncbi:MAG: TraB/VirB10 family protein [Candidatus Nanopelagicales bacterium]
MENNTENQVSSSEGLVKATIRQPGRKNVSRRWMVVGGVLLGFVLLSSTLFSSKPKPGIATPPKSVLDLTPKGLTQNTWQVQSQADIESLRNSVAQLSRENSALAAKAKLAETQSPAQGASAPVPPPPLFGSSGHSNMGALPPPPPPLPPLPRDASPSGAVGVVAPASTESLQPQVFAAPQAEADTSGKGGVLGEKVTTHSTFTKNKYAGYLPAGSFAPVALLNGLDAAASVTAQANPQPVLLRIQDNAVLPGSAHYDLKSCFVIASAAGDLSSERVYIRLAKLSCVDKNNKLVLAAPVQGYVVDSDGKLGLRGHLVDRQGAMLGKSLVAGFAQGLGSAFAMAQSTTSMSALGGVSTISGSAAMQQAGMSGASTAANQLATFYLQEAEAIFPVITVNAGRLATIVIQDGTSLAWNDESALYVKTVTPQVTQNVANPASSSK